MPHMPRTQTTLILAIILVLFAKQGQTADLWVRSNNPAVVSTNDCGAITSLHGTARIHRAFQQESESGMDANMADRVNSGDELVTEAGSRLEMTSGPNAILVLGEASRIKILSLRSFTDTEDKPVTRLDIEVVAGEVRVQVRLNEENPSHVLASLADMEFLASRGDIALLARDGWQAVSFAGEALARTHRGQVTGMPFSIAPRTVTGANGESPLGEEADRTLHARLPFSFELTTLALPPMPSVRPDLEAP